MKKIICPLIAILLFNISHSQISKGNWLFGGNASYSSETLSSDLGDKQNYRTTDIQGNAGYFIADKFAVGIRPDIYFSKAEVRPTTIRSKIFAIGPFLRYYFLPEEQTVNLFIDGSYSFGRSSVTGQKGYSTNQYSVAAGSSFFLNSSVALELMIGYRQTNSDTDINSKNKRVRVGIGFQFHLEKN
jgi:hypothetical protein